jgi:uncharacterized membrane protein
MGETITVSIPVEYAVALADGSSFSLDLAKAPKANATVAYCVSYAVKVIAQRATASTKKEALSAADKADRQANRLESLQQGTTGTVSVPHGVQIARDLLVKALRSKTDLKAIDARKRANEDTSVDDALAHAAATLKLSGAERKAWIAQAEAAVAEEVEARVARQNKLDSLI